MGSHEVSSVRGLVACATKKTTASLLAIGLLVSSCGNSGDSNQRAEAANQPTPTAQADSSTPTPDARKPNETDTPSQETQSTGADETELSETSADRMIINPPGMNSVDITDAIEIWQRIYMDTKGKCGTIDAEGSRTFEEGDIAEDLELGAEYFDAWKDAWIGSDNGLEEGDVMGGYEGRTCYGEQRTPVAWDQDSQLQHTVIPGYEGRKNDGSGFRLDSESGFDTVSNAFTDLDQLDNSPIFPGSVNMEQLVEGDNYCGIYIEAIYSKQHGNDPIDLTPFEAVRYTDFVYQEPAAQTIIRGPDVDSLNGADIDNAPSFAKFGALVTGQSGDEFFLPGDDYSLVPRTLTEADESSYYHFYRGEVWYGVGAVYLGECPDSGSEVQN